MKTATLTLFLAAILFGLYIHSAKAPLVQDPAEVTAMMTIEEYIRKHIGTLSPERPVLGGTFYITDMQINADNQTGTVWYEDGHIALVADFKYAPNSNNIFTITSFIVRN